jgi:Zn-finger nucleic acid-binding protein
MNVKKFAPTCPVCNKQITWKERNQVLATSHCPNCQGLVIEN